MGLAEVDIRYTTVHKVYPPGQIDRCAIEVSAYQTLDWATPKLMWHGENWLEMERCTPILDLEPEQTLRYKKPLRELIQAVHEAGWWHCDVALVNVVVHPTRGPLLIDWENARPASSDISYDLYGARSAGVDPAWPVRGDDGVSWNGPWDTCPGKFWK